MIHVPLFKDFHVEAIVAIDEGSHPTIQTAEGIGAEIESHFEYLGASVHLIAVVPITGQQQEGQ
jgi:hypothetical protein